MERKIEIRRIDLEELINFFRKEDGIELSREEAEEIAGFLQLLIKIAAIKIFDE